MDAPRVETGVLRIGHREERDKRITTHTALTARAFGARYYFLADSCDWSVIRSIAIVEDSWGRSLKEVSCGLNYKDYIEEWRKRGGLIIHLTMYGQVLNEELLEELRAKGKPLLIIIGAEKTPPEIYRLADYNIAIGSQPHSEVAALAVFLDRLYNGEELYMKYENPRRIIVPSTKGKNVVSLERMHYEKARPRGRGDA